MTNPMQPLDPAGAPDPITPAATPSDPAGYAGVTPHGQGPAPYDIQAPMDDSIAGAAAAAAALTGGGEGAPTGAGLPDRMSPRQSQAAALLNSAAGYGGAGGYNIDAGYSGGGGDGGWPNNVDPGANVATPDQGTGDFQGTGTD
jgi:hypothetical protein